MGTIVFAPYPETGHLNPTFQIARKLKARGHRVCYLGVPDFEEPVLRQGFEFVPILAELFPKGFIERQAVGQNLHNYAALFEHAKTADLLTVFPLRLREAAERLRLDLLIVDLLLVDLALVAAQLGLPMALLNTQFYNPWVDRPEVYAPLLNTTELLLCPREFDFPGTKRREESHYVEASIDLERGEDPFVWEQFDDARPLVFCSFGTQSHLIPGSTRFFRATLDALAARPDWQLLLAAGSRLGPEALRPVPPNALVVESAPQLSVLRRASVMITHGGLNSVKECIYFGVPMLVAPSMRDQPENAARVVYHGIGLSADVKEASAAQLLRLLERVSGTASYRTRVGALGEKFRRAEEESPGVRLIESLLGRAHGAQGGAA